MSLNTADVIKTKDTNEPQPEANNKVEPVSSKDIDTKDTNVNTTDLEFTEFKSVRTLVSQVIQWATKKGLDHDVKNKKDCYSFSDSQVDQIKNQDKTRTKTSNPVSGVMIRYTKVKTPKIAVKGNVTLIRNKGSKTWNFKIKTNSQVAEISACS